MNFQQLRIVHETVRRNFNLTEVAAALFTSQSGVSKHIKDLEDELGLELFVRKGKRLLGLTEPGEELAVVVDRMLLDARNIKSIAAQFSNKDHGQLTIATTHTQARYVLPTPVARLRRAYPQVNISLHQGSPDQVARMVLDEVADIGIATESLSEHDELVTLPCYEWQHVLVLPFDHPLRGRTRLSLQDLADHPLVTYHPSFTGRTRIDQAFARQGITPHIALEAIDSDVIKTYVGLGMGIGIVAEMAMQGDHRHPDLIAYPAGDLFGRNLARVAFKRGAYLRQFVLHFGELLSERLSRDLILKALQGPHDRYEL